MLLVLMRASSGLAERINRQVVAAGNPNLRPAHGLVFVRVSGAGATVSELADFLGVTKQSAGAIVDHLVDLGYVARSEHPTDGRAVLIELTPKARRVTEVATAASIAEWDALIQCHGSRAVARAMTVLDDLGNDAAPRPVW